MHLFRRLIHEAHRRSLWQVLGIYALASWAAYQVILDLAEGFGLPTWVPPMAAVLFLVGLPIVLATAFVQEGVPTRDRLAPRERRATPPSGVADDDGELPHGSSSGWRALLTWRRSLVAGVAAFALLGAGTTGYMTMRVLGVGPVGTLVAKGVLEERAPIVLADFSATGADSLLGRVITEAVRIDLIESDIVRLADPRAVSQTLELMGADPTRGLDTELARAVAQRQGLNAVLAGEVGGLGGSYVLAARLVRSDDGSVLAAFRETARDSTHLIGAIDRLSKAVRERVGESLRSIQRSEPLSQVATASLPALRRYSQAVRVIDETGDQYLATELLEEAVALDSMFGMAWRKLGVTLRNMGIRRDRSAEALRRAYELRHRLPELERYQAEAAYYFRVTEDNDAAIEAYRKILAIDPENYVASNNLPLLLIEKRRWAEAESILLDAIRNPAAGQFHYSNLVEAQWSQGKRDDAWATIEAGKVRFPRNLGAHDLELEALKSEGRWAEADSLSRWLLREFGQEASRRPRILLDQADQAAARGRIREALAIGDELGELARQLGLDQQVRQNRLWGARSRLFPYRDSRGALQELAAAVRGLGLDAEPPRDRMYVARAEIVALAGLPDSAEVLLTRWENEVAPILEPGAGPPESHIQEIRARIPFERGDPDPLLAVLRTQSARGSCSVCKLPDLADAFDRLGQSDSARVYFQRYVDTPYLFRDFIDGMWLGHSLERLAQLHDDRGDHQLAARYYARFVELWEDADPELQPRVRAARTRLEGILGRSG